MRKIPKQENHAMKLNSEDRNKLKMAFVSPQIVKYSPIQLHFPDGPDGSPNFPEDFQPLKVFKKF